MGGLRQRDLQGRTPVTSVSVYHPGFQHSGSISDGSYVKCRACGEMVDCYVHEGPNGDETRGHLLVCPWELPAKPEEG